MYNTNLQYPMASNYLNGHSKVQIGQWFNSSLKFYN